MVIFVMKFDVLPDKQQAYGDWLTKGGTLQTQLSVPGIIDLQGFRPVGGASQVLGIYHFASLEDFSKWFHHDEIQRILRESRTLLTNIQYEIWEGSPLSPEPLKRTWQQ